MREQLIAWLVKAMLAWVPLAPKLDKEAETARYTSIAQDALFVAEEANPIFKGDAQVARRRAALLLLSIGSYESHFNQMVDDGRKLGDGGHSHCLNQVLFPTSKHRFAIRDDVWVWAKPEDADGWSGEDLTRDRKNCFRASLAVIRTSFRACGDLTVYTVGHCTPNEPKAKYRMNRATYWEQVHPFKFE